MSDAMPIGFDAAKKDWDDYEQKCRNPRPYNIALWNSLTLGEQQRYGAQECKTKGAIYKIRVAGCRLHMEIDLPVSLIGSGYSEAEARSLEHQLHKKAEEAIHWMIVRRQIEAENA